MRNGIILIGIAFAVALAAVVGNRLSNDALAVVVGAVCGISASIPVTIGLVIAASRNWGREEGVREIGYDYGSNRYAAAAPDGDFRAAATNATALRLSAGSIRRADECAGVGRADAISRSLEKNSRNRFSARKWVSEQRSFR